MTWACAICTFLNGENKTSCEMCGSGRPNASGGGTTGTWICTACTFVNQDSKQNCEMCRTARPIKVEKFDRSKYVDKKKVPDPWPSMQEVFKEARLDLPKYSALAYAQKLKNAQLDSVKKLIQLAGVACI
jgi:hypothetical protein